MSRTPHAWTSNLRRASTLLVVAGFAASALAACGGADSGAGGSSAAVAASNAIASAMASSEATASDPSTPAPTAASTTAASGDDSSQNGFTDAEACTWAKKEVVALKKVSNPDIAQFNILSSLSDFLNNHGGFSDEIKQGTEVDEATQRACPTQHDELLKKANLKSLGDLN